MNGEKISFSGNFSGGSSQKGVSSLERISKTAYFDLETEKLKQNPLLM